MKNKNKLEIFERSHGMVKQKTAESTYFLLRHRFFYGGRNGHFNNFFPSIPTKSTPLNPNILVSGRARNRFEIFPRPNLNRFSNERGLKSKIPQ